MKKAPVILICLLIAITVFGTETRHSSFGSMSHYIEDDYNIYSFPGTLSNYRNVAIYEGSDTTASASATVTYYNEDLNLDFAFLVQKQTFDLRLPSWINYTDAPKNITSVMVGRNNLVFYFGATSSSSDSNEDVVFGDIVRDDHTSLFISTGLGYSTRESNPLDIGLHFSFIDEEENKEENENDPNSHVTTTSDNVGFYGGLKIRKKLNFGKGYIRPYLRLGMRHSNSDYSRTTTSSRKKNASFRSRLDAELGFAYERTLEKNTKLWIGVVPAHFDYITNEYNRSGYSNDGSVSDSSYSEDMLYRRNNSYLFVFIESRLKSWLTARIGIKSYYGFYNDTHSNFRYGEAYTTKQEFFSNSYRVYYGLSAHYKKFTADFTIDPEDLIYRGPQFLTGQSSGSIIGYFSLSYRW